MLSHSLDSHGLLITTYGVSVYAKSKPPVGVLYLKSLFVNPFLQLYRLSSEMIISTVLLSVLITTSLQWLQQLFAMSFKV